MYIHLMEQNPGTTQSRDAVVEVHNFNEDDDIPIFTPLVIHEPELHIYQGMDGFYRVTNPYEQIWFQDIPLVEKLVAQRMPTESQIE